MGFQYDILNEKKRDNPKKEYEKGEEGRRAGEKKGGEINMQVQE